jgi:hypothetical protein
MDIPQLRDINVIKDRVAHISQWGDITDACEVLQMSKAGIYNLMQAGALPKGCTASITRPGKSRGVRRFHIPSLLEYLKDLSIKGGNHEVGTD